MIHLFDGELEDHVIIRVIWGGARKQRTALIPLLSPVLFFFLECGWQFTKREVCGGWCNPPTRSYSLSSSCGALRRRVNDCVHAREKNQATEEKEEEEEEGRHQWQLDPLNRSDTVLMSWTGLKPFPVSTNSELTP